MKVLTNKTLYKCEHCNKMYQVGAACKIHEIKCSKNPENTVACSMCDHLKEVDKHVDVDMFYGYTTLKFKGFRCAVKDIGLYPLKAVHKGLIAQYPETFEDEEVMPKHCELKESSFPF